MIIGNLRMIKKLIISILVVFAGISSYAYFHFYERGHLGLAPEVVQQKWRAAKPDASTLRSGDLIFRHGRGAISNMLMTFSRKDPKYSHSGIVSIENKKVFVYHAIGGEENVSNKLRKDPLMVFCNPNDVHSFGIYRLDLNSFQLQEMDSMAKSYYKLGLEFDTKFDLATDEKMYCSEFVYKMIMGVARNGNYLSLSAVSGMKFIACDGLYLNAHSQSIYSYIY